MNGDSAMTNWEFWIDVGGTFTDVLARNPGGALVPFKLLSNGSFKGRIQEFLSPVRFGDAARRGDPAHFWRGYQFRVFDATGRAIFATRVIDSDTLSGTFTVAAVFPPDLPEDSVYELKSDEEAPVVAIRYLLGLRLDQPIPEVQVRLGTTRGTNALLTRSGARTAFITTQGFADVLIIATQDRPRLFDLDIQKPRPLFEQVIEIDERLNSEGEVIRPLDPDRVREQMRALQASGVVSVAICLLHAFANSAHEQQVAELARETGFTEISVSSQLAPLIKIVPRGDTTVMNAYLNPILKDYIARLRRSLGGSSIRLMTSAGGLIGADRFVGKDSILSGPAGGVIGFSRVAQAAGFPRSIGFDMGGTSTDVSRFDGQYELEFETRKAGVRVVAPMLAIETVAAGGGSICDFDGVKLTVGPASAGADPGPACYGRGGPLTITDMNYFVGKILSARFPFPLNREVVEHKLQILCRQIAVGPGGQRYTPLQLAEGFIEVANANMVRPIRNISVAKGYDPRDYVLVTFGGAGAQHACAVARALGIRQVLSHPWSGILSAYGMGQADVRRHQAQSILRPYSPEQVQSLDSIFCDLEAAVLAEVAAEGVPAEQIQRPVRSLDLRYSGVEATLNVPCPPDGDYARRYAELHQQLYGYQHAGRALEITAARVEAIGTAPRLVADVHELYHRTPVATETVAVSFHGQVCQTGVFTRAELQPGDSIAGPAIICEPTSTVVVDPGFTAEIRSAGEIVLTDNGSGTHSAQDLSTAADPVRLEIFNNLFASIAERMGTTLQRTSFSTNVKERLDFSCAIFSPTGNLVVNAPHIPVHLGAMSETVKRIIADNPKLGPGDVYVTNDPYRGGSHLPDVTVITPVHHAETRELLFFTASRAHHAEIGGIVPGSMPPFSKNLAEEGVLIRNFKLLEDGRSHEDALRELLLSGPYPTRAVRDNLADVSAQVAANQSGAIQLLDLIRHYSQPVVQAYLQHIQDAAETKMRRALSAMPAGDYVFEDRFDDGSPVKVKITIQGDSAIVDFTGTGPVVPGNLNANPAIVTSAVLYVFRLLINEDIPLNSGVLAPVKIIVPESLLNPPDHPDPAQRAAVVGGNVEVSQKVVDTLLGALGLAAASQGTMNNLTFGDGTFGYYETICGGSGATATANGADAVHTHMTNTRLTDPEVLERRYPVRLWEFSIRHGAGGAGAHHGGAGIIRRLEFLQPLKVSILSERRGPSFPFGLNGGEPGARGRNSLVEAGTNKTIDLGGKAQLQVQAGDVLTIETPGGGGFGLAPIGAAE
jgi:5-oxoprolinase (ATP-hydrolysing)